MELGITGLPQTGKTTLFNALTGEHAETGGYSTGKESHIAVVKVPDERLDVLTGMFHPKKTVPADVRYVDVAGIVKGVGKDSRAGMLSALRSVDALLHVVRAFDSDAVPEPDGGVDPIRDAGDFDLELILADMDVVDRRLERLAKDLRVGKKEGERENELLLKCRDALDAEQPLRELELPPEEEKLLRGFQFLTRKPIVVVVNVGEKQLGESGYLASEVQRLAKRPNTEVVVLCAEVEMEVSRLDAADQPIFLEELHIVEPAVRRLIRVSYQLLSLLSFFTVGPDEVRAWTIHRGALAPEAAGVIHSDLERGFIRAEVIAYDDLISSGSIAHGRDKGVLRLEGKTYPVKDGDILNIRFSV
jgi:hypothetical protein